MLLNI
jgi:hypothetical protein